MVTAVEVGVLLTFLRVLVRRMARLDMVRKMRIRRMVRHARHRRRSIVKPAEQQDEHKQQAKGSGGHGRAPNSEWLVPEVQNRISPFRRRVRPPTGPPRLVPPGPPASASDRRRSLARGRGYRPGAGSSEGGRGGHEGVSAGGSRGSPYHKK